MEAMDEAASTKTEARPGLRCDFCGQPALRVRRVALDAGYERLQTPHPVRYACPACSEAKERSRTGEES
jgi:hypothetical protein